MGPVAAVARDRSEAGISDGDFRLFQNLVHRIAGIHLPETKKALLTGRLGKRLRAREIPSYGAYYRLVTDAGEEEELRSAIELLTTNETYFFREPRHFEILRDQIVLPTRESGRTFRAWSAACSSGEETYTIAMVLAEALGDSPWEVLGSDINTRMLALAGRAQYRMERIDGIPQEYLRKYCLKGTGAREGTFMIDAPLRKRVRFAQVNLNEPLPPLGEFDVIFLRNVLIYFDLDTKRKVVERLAQRLKQGAWFVIGHSESLNGITDVVRQRAPTVYQRE